MKECYNKATEDVSPVAFHFLCEPFRSYIQNVSISVRGAIGKSSYVVSPLTV